MCDETQNLNDTEFSDFFAGPNICETDSETFFKNKYFLDQIRDASDNDDNECLTVVEAMKKGSDDHE